MKYSLLLALLLSVCPFLAFAQSDYEDGTALVTLNVLVDDNAGFAGSSQQYIKDKLMQVIMQNGLGAADYSSRFVMTASVIPGTKDIIPGPPMQVSQSLDYTFYIVDNYEQKIFATTVLTNKVVEASEEKALLRSIRSINPKNRKLVSFAEEGRIKIIDYYNSRIDNIIEKARLLAKTRSYSEAFYVLGAVPEACSDAYSEAVTVAGEIYKEYVDYTGEQNLAKAKVAWAAQQNSEGAALAGQYLSQIYPDAACYSKAEALYAEIKAKVLADWKFEMKKYDDAVDLEKQRIQAWKEVGVAYGNHQPASTISWMFR